jgi:hypothetical protein
MVGLLERDAPMGAVPFPAIPPPASQQVPAIAVLSFWTVYKEDGSAEDWVSWVKKGENAGSITNDAIKRLQPNPARNRHGTVEWEVVGPAYEAWKKGEETPITGTPLFAWAGVPREMIEQLKKVNIYSIEDLADFPDHNISKVPIPAPREWRQRARAYREAQSTSDVGHALATRDKTIEQQGLQLTDMQRKMEEMSATLTAMQSGARAAVDTVQRIASPDDEFIDQTALVDVSPSPPPRKRA